MEEFSHILHQVIIQAQVLNLFLKIFHLLLRLQQNLQPLLKPVILYNQIPNVRLLVRQLCLQMLNVLIPTFNLLFVIFFQAHLAVSHHNFELAFLIFNCSA